MRIVVAVAPLLALGCALAHERPGDGGRAHVDAAVRRCEDFWRGLPACPVDGAGALDRPCPSEGARCGTECCEPGPAITCRAGRWTAAMPASDCAGVRCAAANACGPGVCGPDATCLLDAEAPTPTHVCAGVRRADWPSHALDADPIRCTLCIASGPFPEVVELTANTPPLGACR